MWGWDGNIRFWNLNLGPLKQACRSRNIKEIMLIKEICHNAREGMPTYLPVGSDQARLLAALPKLIRTIIARYVTHSPIICTIQ